MSVVVLNIKAGEIETKRDQREECEEGDEPEAESFGGRKIIREEVVGRRVHGN